MRRILARTPLFSAMISCPGMIPGLVEILTALQAETRLSAQSFASFVFAVAKQTEVA